VMAIAKTRFSYNSKYREMKRTIVNPVIKDTVTFLQTAEDSGGKVTEADITLMPGGGNPLHYHKTYSETFTAIDGDLGLKLGRGKTRVLREGETYTVEPGALHSFYNPTDREIKFNVKLMPGHAGFENSLRIIYGLASDGLTDKNTVPKSIKHTAIVVCMSDMNLPGFFTLMFPVLKLIAKRAQTRGEGQNQIER